METTQSVQPPQIESPDNNPPPPQPGMTPTQIVNGFLEAMTATPLQTSTAQLFLTTTGKTLWEPQQSVVAYTACVRRREGGRPCRSVCGARSRVGAAGQWLGRLSPAASRMSFPMQPWRTASGGSPPAPNALLVPRGFYDQAFQDASLYFFDPSARILVPEVVHMPQGQQLTTALVQALVLGPQPALAGVARTFVPARLTVNPVVVSQGVADVTLRDSDPGPTGRRTTRLMLTQFAWTLRQDPSVKAFTVNIGGRQVDRLVRVVDVPRRQPRNRSPATTRRCPRASSQLYALRRGRLVSGPGQPAHPGDRPVRHGRPGHRSVRGQSRGQPGRRDDTDRPPGRSGARQRCEAQTTVLSGRGLLRPAWDFAGRLWEVENTRSEGAVVVYIAHGRSHEVHVPGLTGQDVRLFLVSRDASRLVAVVHGAVRDRLVVSRLRYDVNGRHVSGTRAKALRWSAGTGTRIRDIGWWTSPTRIAVLDQVSDSQAEVRTLAVDGSTSPVETPPIIIPGRAFSLVTSP